MANETVVIQRYSDQSDALHDQDYLESCGIHATTAEVRDENSETGTVHVLRVDRQRARQAYETLKEYYESEKDEKFVLMGDWGEDMT